tara:strand:+ start:1620 stop:1910 length:291 start_codon:yes stop_codon:yes gene_type:complete
MKYIKNIISFFIPTIKINFDNFSNFYESLQEETEEFIENLDSYYLSGLLNYSIDGCLSYDNAEQLLEEHDVVIDDYLDDTKDYDLSIINLVDYLGY